MRALMIGMDRKFYHKDTETRKRMVQYGAMLEEYHIVLYTLNHFKPEKLSANVWLYPTNSLSRLFFIFSALRICRRIIKEHRIDTLITHDPVFTGLPALLLVKIFKLKLLASVYGTDFFNPLWANESLRNKLFVPVGKLVLRRADAIQTDNLDTAKELTARFGDKVFWKPLIPSYLGLYKDEKKISAEKLNILFVARLVGQKNIPFLVEVADKVLKASNGNVIFTIVGDGALWPYLNQEIESRGLGGGVRLVKGCATDQLLGLYKQAEIFILTSLYEGFPRVFMEAAAIGTPIVTTRFSGMPDIVRDGQNGFIVDQGDLDGFVEKLLKLVNNPDLRAEFSKTGKDYFWEHYGPDMPLKMQAKIFDFLRSAKSSDGRDVNPSAL